MCILSWRCKSSSILWSWRFWDLGHFCLFVNLGCTEVKTGLGSSPERLAADTLVSNAADVPVFTDAGGNRIWGLWHVRSSWSQAWTSSSSSSSGTCPMGRWQMRSRGLKVWMCQAIKDVQGSIFSSNFLTSGFKETVYAQLTSQWKFPGPAEQHVIEHI